jgi:hypothetical protein
MAKFCFYSKQDPTQEAIGACEALSTQEAIKFFALSKMLPVDQFQILFGVKQFTYEESNQGNNRQLLTD